MRSFRERFSTPLTTRDVLIRLWVLAWLTFVWVLLWGDFTIANVVGGLIVGFLIMLLLPLPQVPVEGRLHPLSALRLAGRIAVDLVVSSVQLAWLAIRPGPPPLSAMYRTQVAVKSDVVLSLLVNAINLIPGTLVLEIDRVRRLLYIHVLDVGTPQAVGRFRHQTHRLERLFIRAFERDDDWHPSDFHVDDEHDAPETTGEPEERP
ncbi:Na+/H+ antiporter subunit E [Speluncibacter jeojiensis]|uniref:Na+/H+ antiporter subunit E n=1 Tax=Speluncibacter jeojiensis TaxID=2710754 RepID=A0A9X4M3R2_9ACTN|nr:Na+/H+ antiporter subunit E [Corynebacteriales bacterium D3-21]